MGQEQSAPQDQQNGRNGNHHHHVTTSKDKLTNNTITSNDNKSFGHEQQMKSEHIGDSSMNITAQTLTPISKGCNNDELDRNEDFDVVFDTALDQILKGVDDSAENIDISISSTPQQSTPLASAIRDRSAPQASERRQIKLEISENKSRLAQTAQSAVIEDNTGKKYYMSGSSPAFNPLDISALTMDDEASAADISISAGQKQRRGKVLANFPFARTSPTGNYNWEPSPPSITAVSHKSTSFSEVVNIVDNGESGVKKKLFQPVNIKETLDLLEERQMRLNQKSYESGPSKSSSKEETLGILEEKQEKLDVLTPVSPIKMSPTSDNDYGPKKKIPMKGKLAILEEKQKKLDHLTPVSPVHNPLAGNTDYGPKNKASNKEKLAVLEEKQKKLDLVTPISPYHESSRNNDYGPKQKSQIKDKLQLLEEKQKKLVTPVSYDYGPVKKSGKKTTIHKLNLLEEVKETQPVTYGYRQEREKKFGSTMKKSFSMDGDESSSTPPMKNDLNKVQLSKDERMFDEFKTLQKQVEDQEKTKEETQHALDISQLDTMLLKLQGITNPSENGDDEKSVATNFTLPKQHFIVDIGTVLSGDEYEGDTETQKLGKGEKKKKKKFRKPSRQKVESSIESFPSIRERLEREKLEQQREMNAMNPKFKSKDYHIAEADMRHRASSPLTPTMSLDYNIERKVCFSDGEEETQRRIDQVKSPNNQLTLGENSSVNNSILRYPKYSGVEPEAGLHNLTPKYDLDLKGTYPKLKVNENSAFLSGSKPGPSWRKIEKKNDEKSDSLIKKSRLSFGKILSRRKGSPSEKEASGRKSPNIGILENKSNSVLGKTHSKYTQAIRTYDIGEKGTLWETNPINTSTPKSYVSSFTFAAYSMSNKTYEIPDIADDTATLVSALTFGTHQDDFSFDAGQATIEMDEHDRAAIALMSFCLKQSAKEAFKRWKENTV